MYTLQKSIVISLTVHSLIFGLLLLFRESPSSEDIYDKPVVIDFALINPLPPAQAPLKTDRPDNTKKDTPAEQYTERVDENSTDTIDSMDVDTEVIHDNLQTEQITEQQRNDSKDSSSETSNTESSSSVAVNIYIKEKFSYISTIISSNIDYPYLAQVRHQEGTLLLSFVIALDGSVSDIRVLKSSGFDILDKNAVSTVKKSAPFPRPPCIAELKIPVAYKLM
ncbi:MAG TPA: energy transducer TonB [Chitinispirillaceae bacterium]|nr:energy transducer TonB [Chitinispirillaceae bacterium]